MYPPLTDSASVPVRMRRPSAAREALSRSPLVEAGWADATSVERVPFVTAGAGPVVLLAGRPSAERAADAWAGGIAVLLLLNLVIHNNRRSSGSRFILFQFEQNWSQHRVVFQICYERSFCNRTEEVAAMCVFRPAKPIVKFPIRRRNMVALWELRSLSEYSCRRSGGQKNHERNSYSPHTSRTIQKGLCQDSSLGFLSGAKSSKTQWNAPING